MVYESATVFPTPEGAQLTSPPPLSTYGFQKLASEYFAKGAWEQYQLPYTILRPFNCVGIGERRAAPRHGRHERQREARAVARRARTSSLKVLKGQDPLHILGEGNQVRHYTYGGDLARGIRLAMESPKAVNEDFNLSTAASTTVLELAESIWRKVHGPTDGRSATSPTRRSSTTSSCRVPDVRKAREVLGFEATTTLDAMLDEVIPWIRSELEAGPPVTTRRPRPSIYDDAVRRRARSAPKDAVWREIVALPAALDPGRRAGARRRLRSRPLHPPGDRARERWATDIRDVSASMPSGRPIRPGVDGLDLSSAVPHEHFGTVFVSNYLEHLRSGDAVIEQLAGRRDAPRGRAAGSSCCSRTSGSSAPRYWDFIDHRVALTERSLARGCGARRPSDRRRSSPLPAVLDEGPPADGAGCSSGPTSSFRPAWRLLGPPDAVRRERPRDRRDGRSGPGARRSSCPSTTRATAVEPVLRALPPASRRRTRSSSSTTSTTTPTVPVVERLQAEIPGFAGCGTTSGEGCSTR